MSKQQEDYYKELYKKVEPILLEYGLNREQAEEAFYSQMQEYENQIQDLKLPGVRNKDKIEIIKNRIPQPLTDENFLDRIKKIKNA